MILKLWPAKCLTSKNVEWTDSVEKLKTLLEAMNNWMTMAGGVGIAAPQVGESVKVAIVAAPGREQVVMVNPRVIWRSDAGVTVNEGCLSFPGAGTRVVRASEIEVEYLDAFLQSHRTIFKDKEAVIVQHELDHLAGRTILDHASTLSKSLIRAKVRTFKKKVLRDAQQKTKRHT